VHAGIGSTPKLTISKAEVGSKENEACSNRGNCDLTSGVCTCYVGYTTSDGEGGPGDRGDCGATDSTIIACPVRISQSVLLNLCVINAVVIFCRERLHAVATGTARGHLSFAASA
jgi:hypothetical protein